MKFRRMTEKDRPQYDDLCRHAFGMSHEHTERFLNWVWQHNYTFGAFDGAKLAAGMWYNLFEMRVGEGYVPMGGVSAVATWPEYRKLGLAKQLMGRAQSHMRDNGCPTSTLIPFKFSFYEQMGYAQALDMQVCEFDPQGIRDLPDEDYDVREIDASCWREMERIHLEFGRRYNGTLRRDRYYWQKICLRKEAGVNRKGYLVTRGKTPCGQIILTMKEPRDFQTSEMTVFFLGWTDPGAERAIFRFFKSHRDQMKNIKVFLPPDFRVERYFARPRITRKIEPKMMFKLVDAAQALKLRVYPKTLSGSVKLALTGDDTAPWNTGTYEIVLASGKIRITRTTPRRKTADAVGISIQQLSQLYLGYYSVTELQEMNAVAGPAKSLKLLESMFPQTPTYIEDWY
jgi:predicted acetyltransferase